MCGRALLVAALLMAAMPGPLAAQPIKLELPAEPETPPTMILLSPGTSIAARTADEISSKLQRKGDLVRLIVAEDTLVDDHIVVPKGTPIVAEVTLAQEKGTMGQAGALAARLLYLDLPSGPVRLSGELGTRGRDKSELAVAATALVSGFAFLIEGKNAVIPAGTQVTATLDREARVPVAASTFQAAASPVSSEASSP